MKITLNAKFEASLLKTASLDAKKLESALSNIMTRYSYLHSKSNLSCKEEKSKNNYFFDVKENVLMTDNEVVTWCEQLCAHLSCENGPGVSIGLMKRTESQGDLLFVAIHGKLVDRVAWRVFVSELCAVYHDYALPGIKNNYSQWMYGLSAYAKDSVVLGNHFNFWFHTVNKIRQSNWILKLPKNTNALLYKTHATSLEKKIFQKLKKQYSENAVKGGLKDVCLTALLYAFSDVFSHKKIPLMISETGRQHLYKAIDPSRLVGNCQISFPLIFEIDGDLSSIENPCNHTLNKILEQKNSQPSSGLGYHALRLFHPENTAQDKLSLEDALPLCFHYLGEYDQLDPHSDWRIDSQYPGWINIFSEHGSGLAVNFLISDEKLYFHIQYEKSFFDQEKIQALSEKMYVYLENITKENEIIDVGAQHFISDPSYRSSVKHYESFLVLNHEKVNSTPIVFAPPGGGGAESYLNLLQEMKIKEGRIILLNNYLKDSGDLTHFPSSFESLAAIYIDHLSKQVISDGISLVGYSFGGVLAFEIANQLEERGISVKDLYLIDPIFVGDFVNEEEMLSYKKLRRDIEFIAHYNVNKKPIPDANLHFFKSTKKVYFGENPDINERKIIEALSEPLNGLRLPKGRKCTMHNIDSDHYQLLSKPFIEKIMLSIFNGNDEKDACI